MYQKRGLTYTALDDNGNKIGTPINASAFYSKPTLKYLEQKFLQNEPLRQVHQKRLKVAIQWTLVKGKISLDQFTQALAREGINVVIRQSSQGNIYGLTYIDFKTKCVFNGSDLGKEFSAKGIFEQLRQEQKQEALNQVQMQANHIRQRNTAKFEGEGSSEHSNLHLPKIESLNAFDSLLKSEQTNDYLPKELLKKKKQKKKSKRLHL